MQQYGVFQYLFIRLTQHKCRTKKGLQPLTIEHNTPVTDLERRLGWPRSPNRVDQCIPPSHQDSFICHHSTDTSAEIPIWTAADNTAYIFVFHKYRHLIKNSAQPMLVASMLIHPLLSCGLALRQSVNCQVA